MNNTYKPPVALSLLSLLPKQQRLLQCGIRGIREAGPGIFQNRGQCLRRLHSVSRSHMLIPPLGLRSLKDGKMPAVLLALFVLPLPEIAHDEVGAHLKLREDPLEILLAALSKACQLFDLRGQNLPACHPLKILFNSF